MLSGRKFPLIVWIIGIAFTLSVPVYIWSTHPSTSWLNNATLGGLVVVLIMITTHLIRTPDKFIK